MASNQMASNLTIGRLNLDGIVARVNNPKKEILKGRREIAAYLECSPGCVSNYINQLNLPAIRTGQLSEYQTTKTLIDTWLQTARFCIIHKGIRENGQC